MRRLLVQRRPFSVDKAREIASGPFGGGSLGLVTDTEFLAGRDGIDGFGDNHDYRNWAYAKEKAAGRDTSGFYSQQLGRFVESRADVERKARELGLAASGPGIDVPSDPVVEVERTYTVADHIVEEEVLKVEDEHGPLPEQERQDLWQETQDRLSGDHRKYTAVE